jgi:adenylosuccinate synthase
MSVCIVVGGQYGSEAKAKAAVHQAKRMVTKNIPVMGVRCGGPNAGHTVYFGDERYVLRHVPSLVSVPSAKLVICSGSMINPHILKREVKEIEGMEVPVRSRLMVSQDAAVVADEYIDWEKSEGLGDMIGSTQTGTGATAAARCMREAKSVHLSDEFRDFDVDDTFTHVHEFMGEGGQVIVEGTQGFGLSLFHSGHYPFCTSKDTTASAFASEAGIAPTDVNEVIMVIRTYPIRVGGNSGKMQYEIPWSEIQKRCNSPEPLIEMTSVTKKVRRVGEFDYGLVMRAVEANKPTQIAVHGIDYINWKDRGVRDLDSLSHESKEWLMKLQTYLRVPITMAFTGPHQDDVVDAL